MKRPKKIFFYLKNPFVIFYTSLRVLSAVYILFNPLWGFILTVFFDFWDGYFYEMIPKLVEMPRPTYQFYDKIQDWLGYIFMWIASFGNPAFLAITLLLVYRFIGQIIFEIIKKQAVFAVFTNFFEASFLWYILFPILNLHPASYWLYIILLLYELREIFLHIYWPWTLKNYGFPRFLQKYFGVRKEALW